MDNVLHLQMPAVFNTGTVMRLAESNHALRQLRQLGCRVVSLKLARTPVERTEIVVDRNPHDRLIGCPSVHVTFALGCMPTHITNQ